MQTGYKPSKQIGFGDIKLGRRDRDVSYISITDDHNKNGKELHDIVQKRFSFVHLGHSFRCTELEAAIGLAQLEKKDSIVKKRQSKAKYLTNLLKDLQDELQLPTVPSDRDHVFMMYPIVLKNESKIGLVKFLQDNMIETRDMFPLVTQPVYTNLFGDIEKNLPVSAWIRRNGFYVGCHQYLTRKELRLYIRDDTLLF